MRCVLRLLCLLLLPMIAHAQLRLPAKIDSAAHYVFYLHGGIVIGTNGRPVHDSYGPYEYEKILARFRADGFEVISAIRPRYKPPEEDAAEVVHCIEQLRRAGVASERIAVVGASVGAIIATYVSARMNDPEVRYVMLAGLYEDAQQKQQRLTGRVLSVHDASETRRIIPEYYFAHSPDLAASKSIVTRTGLDHGLIYTPHDAWYLPTLDWLRAKSSR